MRRLRIQSPLVDKTIKTTLGADYASGTSLTVLSNNSFTANDLLIIGELSEELTELKQLTSVSANTGMTLPSAPKFSHSKGTSIYKSLWDQISIESRSSSAGVFAVTATPDIQWDNENNETVYYDQNGTDAYQYRFRFYNSVTTTYSEYSPTLGGAGFTRQQVGYMIREVRKIVNDLERKIVTDDEIIRFYNRGQDIVYAHNTRYWFLKVDTYKQNTGIAAIADTGVYSLESYPSFGSMDIVRFRYTNGGSDRLYSLSRDSDIDFDAATTDLNRGTDDYPSSYKLLPPDSDSSTGYIQINPVTKTTGIGTIYPIYYDKMSNLESVDDETRVPMPDILCDFAISQIERIKGNDEKSKMYLDLFLGPKDQRGGFENITGLKLLDKMDASQGRASGQPRSFKTFRGRRGAFRSFGNPRMNHDDFKEDYME